MIAGKAMGALGSLRGSGRTGGAGNDQQQQPQQQQGGGIGGKLGGMGGGGGMGGKLGKLGGMLSDRRLKTGMTIGRYAETGKDEKGRETVSLGAFGKDIPERRAKPKEGAR